MIRLDGGRFLMGTESAEAFPPMAKVRFVK